MLWLIAGGLVLFIIVVSVLVIRRKGSAASSGEQWHLVDFAVPDPPPGVSWPDFIDKVRNAGWAAGAETIEVDHRVEQFKVIRSSHLFRADCPSRQSAEACVKALLDAGATIAKIVGRGRLSSF
jgi:hypothetical protein